MILFIIALLFWLLPWIVLGFCRIKADKYLLTSSMWKLLGFWVCIIVSSLLLFLVMECTLTVLAKPTSATLSKHALSYFFHTVSGDLPEYQNMGLREVLFFLMSLTGYVLLSGFLVSFCVNIFQRRVNKVRMGDVSYPWVKNHYVVIGGRSLVGSVVEMLEQRHNRNGNLTDKRAYILILTSELVPEVRRRLSARLEDKTMRRVVLLHGGRTCLKDLKRLNIPRCREVFILGDSNETNRDDLNMECARMISDAVFSKYLKRERKKICRVFFDQPTTYFLFQKRGSNILANINFEPCCFYKNWAEKIFGSCNTQEDKKQVQYRPLDYKPVTADSDLFVHLIVVGMSRMGMTLGMEAAHMSHFPNFPKKNIKSRITFIDKNAEQELNRLKNRMPAFLEEVGYSFLDIPSASGKTFVSPKSNFMDLDLEFIKGDIESLEMRNLLEKYATDNNALVTLAVCLPQSAEALSIGLSLPALFYEKEIPILIQQESSHGVLQAVHELDDELYKLVLPFGMLDEDAGIAAGDDIGACVVQYLYEYQKTQNQSNTTACPYTSRSAIEEYLRENLPNRIDMWGDLETWEKISNRYNALSIQVKLRSIGFEDIITTNVIQAEEKWHKLRQLLKKNLVLLSEVEHNRWNMEKLLIGYRPMHSNERDTYEKLCSTQKQEYKDACKSKFIHKDIVAYEDLEDVSKRYDIFMTLYLYLIAQTQEM